MNDQPKSGWFFLWRYDRPFWLSANVPSAFLSPERKKPRKKPGFYENCGFLPDIWVRNPVSAENLWNRGLATSSQFEVSDGNINAFGDPEFVLGKIDDRDRQLQDVKLIWQEQLGQVTNQAKTIYLHNENP